MSEFSITDRTYKKGPIMNTSVVEVNKTMGRPTLYTDQVLEQGYHYLDNYTQEGDPFPSTSGLAVFLGVGRQTLYNWARSEGKEEFMYLLDRLQTKQEQVLWSQGMRGNFNANLCKLALGKHGYRDELPGTSADSQKNLLLGLNGALPRSVPVPKKIGGGMRDPRKDPTNIHVMLGQPVPLHEIPLSVLERDEELAIEQSDEAQEFKRSCAMPW